MKLTVHFGLHVDVVVEDSVVLTLMAQLCLLPRLPYKIAREVNTYVEMLCSSIIGRFVLSVRLFLLLDFLQTIPHPNGSINFNSIQ